MPGKIAGGPIIFLIALITLWIGVKKYNKELLIEKFEEKEKMKLNNKGFTVIELVFAVLVIFSIIGWGMNLYKLASCNFSAPYKAEVIRGVGVFVVPVGCVTGYFDIDD